MEWFTDDNLLAKLSFILGWLFGGFGVVGQPHIMIRLMTLNNAKNVNKLRLYYYSWFTTFYFLTIIIGLAARLYIPNANFEAELALPTISMMLLPSVLVGVVLAGIFSATISTADSLVLSCSASLTRDFTKNPIRSYKITKLATVFITLFALSIALYSSSGVFELVLDAWSVLASAFAPLIVVYSLNKKVGERLALLMIFSGVFILYISKLYMNLNIYEIAPAMSFGFLIYIIGNKIKWLNP